MCNPQTLAALEDKIATNAHLLHEALRAALLNDQNDDQTIIAVKQGIAYLQELSRAAGAADLQGLQTVCILSNQHFLQTLQQPDFSRKQAACAALEYFPKLVANYLQEPHNPSNQQALIEHLQRAEWASPLTPTSATLLAELLANDLSNTLPIPPSMPIEELKPNEHDLALAAELDAAFNPSPNTHALFNEEPQATYDNNYDAFYPEGNFEEFTLNDLQNQITTPVYETPLIEENFNSNITPFSESELATPYQTSDDVPWDDLAQHITPHLTEPLQPPEQLADFETLTDDILADTLAKQTFTQLESNFEFNALSLELETNALNADFLPAKHELEKIADLNTPFSENQALPLFQEQALFQDNAFDEQSYVFENNPSKPEKTIENISEEIPEDFVPLYLNETTELEPFIEEPYFKQPTVQNFVSQPLQPVEKQPTFSCEEILTNVTPILQHDLDIICQTTDEVPLSNAVGDYIRYWHEIEHSTTDPILNNAIAFIKENLHHLAMSPIEERQQAQGVFEVFPTLLLDYIHNPQNQSLILTSFLQNPAWFAPLSEQEATKLLKQISANENKETPQIFEVPPLNIPAQIPQINKIVNLIDTPVDKSKENENTQEETQLEEMSFEELEALEQQEHVLTEEPSAENEEMSFEELEALEQQEHVLTEESSVEEGEQLTDLTDPFAISSNELDNLQKSEIEPFVVLEDNLLNGANEKTEEPLVEVIDPAVILEPVNSALMMAFDDLSATTQRIVSADDDSEELLDAVGHYTEALQPVLDAAESNNLTGILEVGSFLNENILAFGMLPKAERQHLQENLDLFPALLLDYLLAPQESADNLIEYLKNPNWSAPLSEERAQEIKAALLQIGQLPAQGTSSLSSLSGESSELETSLGDIYLGKPEQVERVNAAIMESAEVLSTSLENFVSMQNDNELFLEAVDTYTTHVQNIWDAAEQAGLSGLQDVCNFINENIMALSTEDIEKRQLVHEQLDAWPMLMLNYLTSPADNIAPLVEHLKHPHWIVPLNDSQAEQLTKALQQGSTKSDILPKDPFVDAFATMETAPVQEPVESESTSESGDEISLGNAEMLEMLSGEIESAQADLNDLVEKFVNTPNNHPEFAEISSNYSELVGRLAMASEMVGLIGLKEVCDFVISNVGILADKPQSERQKSKEALQKWPSLVLAYLKAPTNNIVALLNHFRENDWPAPLPDEKAHDLLNKLRSSSAVPEDDDSTTPSRATQAKPEDIVLQIPEDVNQDLLAAYLQEAPQNAADFTACLQRIVKNPTPEDVKLAQRIAHTLKGSSNIIGIKGVATLAHNLEDILEYLFENAVPPPPALTKTMIEAADTLEVMIDSLQGKEEPPANALAVLQEVLDWANRIDRNQLNVSDEEIAKRKAEIAAQVATAPKPTAAPAGGGATAQAAAPAEVGETEQFLRVPTRTIDNLLRLIGEMSISVGQIQERLKHVIHSTKSLNAQEMMVQHKGYELETLVVVRDVTNRRKHRLNIKKNIIAEDQQQAFDSLEFEQYNELHSLTHSFIESIADSRELSASILEDLTALDGMFIHQERLNKEFQQIVMTTRMVPIKTIIARLERIVRQTCRSTDKLAELVMIGGDILIDGDVLNKLIDPLMHILRNAIDHGMELPAERVAAGKPETGTITIRCFRQGNNIVVRCEDDGRGLNFEKIRQIAIERGLITENQELSPRELSRLILIPGFSTKGAVTQVSGRGVGMDVVHTSILELKGSLEIESEPGRGSAMVLILPMTLVTEHVLLVGVANQKFALPTHHLAQALTPDSGEFRRIGDVLNFHMNKNAYPVTTLAELLGLSGSPPASENDTRPLVLVKGEGTVNAVIVDYLYDSRNLVSKTMGRYVKKVRGIAGASILGDGSVVAMIDLPELLRSPTQSLMPLSGDSGETSDTPATNSVPHIMIVDDSLSVRKVLSQLMEDQGFQPMLAKDGLEAVEQVSQRKPDVMLVDMEMPRMNGIELTAHIRANEATKHIPIFMITSRTTEKHRQLAKEAGVTAYLTKPYQDSELLGLINEALRNKR